MEIVFLGTGTSHGVPVIGCNCKTCQSKNPRNKRTRSSIYVKFESFSILVDTPPELRLQLLNNGIHKVDAILYTHSHADHIMGFDDIRAFNLINKRPLPCYGNSSTIKDIKRTFNYIFNAVQMGGGLPQVQLIEVNSTFFIEDIKIIPLPVKHGKLDILGYRFGRIAYITDCSHIPESTYDKLEGLDILIIDALRYRPHPTHMNISEALEVIEKTGVSRAYLTHLSHSVEHEELKKNLPSWVRPAYDGLKIII
ncbi:MBL fold metallo-hydrolase [Halothermothrix orenii]|uniref:Beta-lactamase domain protein n=1 Tax=Halothermothrix orenii (strain H 168 / OCM 544 / DSM 9562) TaxID=373903 RepID=B8CX35_HALOH|nr:MBL fold metallo-hydrolase [Halothermothrix orenii]ACL69854.1 beta-lactamase domain protein [Halothermothrix orenii H 168]